MKHLIKLIILCLMVTSLFLVGCKESLPAVEKTSLDCTQLSKQLEIEVTEKDFIDVPLQGNREVGGVLLEVSEPYRRASSDPLLFRTLTFQGYSKQVKMIWRGLTEDVFPYEIGKFYQFDTENIRVSGALSGAFIDTEKQLLKEIVCE